MSSNGDNSFERRPSLFQQRRLSTQFKKNAWLGPPSDIIYAGISASFSEKYSIIAIAFRDTTYLLDFVQKKYEVSEGCDGATNFIIDELEKYTNTNLEKIIGAAIPQSLADRCPKLCSRLWAELDIIPLVLPEASRDRYTTGSTWDCKHVDEQAESMARKCVRLFGPEKTPLLQVGLMGTVEVDTDFHVRLTNLDDFQNTVSHRTWSAVQHYASDLKDRKVKIAFFSATPQGGGVALMRHALVRFSHYLGTNIKWYVPKPWPGVFRVTKNIHNILQGVAHPDERLSTENKNLLQDWIAENARRYWTSPGGPLCSTAEGGADVIIIDDPQMPGLIPIAKKGSEAHRLKRGSFCGTKSNLLIASSATQLDGLNKHMCDKDVAHYGRIFNAACRNAEMLPIKYPEEKYIVQIARFDPSKGIFDVLNSYEKFYNRLVQERPDLEAPKLLICGHGSVDDPDGTVIYDQVIEHIDVKIPFIQDSICVIRLRPSDQVLNALLSKATIVLQLSTREGFEVKVSEALHKGKPVIATRAGGIPLQVEDTKNGFLVDVGDTDAVAQHLYDLWTDEVLYTRISQYALSHVSDEVSTVGNTVNWLYLASKFSKGESVKPNERWIYDLAFEELGIATTGEPQLTRAVKLENMG
ncbi:hypothetical protein N7495_007917 [Penicillium taxi]|uniref:uncharacterized protein n=1 Tax=Penicillium taxi TaxID=168475 RepID=UPI0025451C2F|nr:uncharacterized protein N7495_007917 [Penicillium taxi]KAJ5887876.1 hypothetical protein N7495_007917 [Penicillium taxi]